jgi:uncharacterized repeat protein (TIGR01451 family)
LLPDCKIGGREILRGQKNARRFQTFNKSELRFNVTIRTRWGGDLSRMKYSGSEGMGHRVFSWLPRIVPVVTATLVLFTTLAIVVHAAQTSIALVSPDLSVLKQDAATDVRPGGTLSYRVFYENSGSAPADDVVITDTLPPYTTHVLDTASSQAWTRTVSDTFVVWQRPALVASAGGSFDVVLRVDDAAPAGTSLVNRVTIDSATREDVTTNNSSATAASVVRVADVHVTKSGPAVIASGDRVTYTVDYGNDGSESADDVVITDTLPAGMTFVGASGDSPAAPSVNAQDVVWTIGAVPAFTDGTLTVTADIHADQPSYSVMTNSVRIATTTPEQDHSDNEASSGATVSPGVPASVQVFVPASVPVDSSVAFTVEVNDRWVNPVADSTPVTFQADDLVDTDPLALTVNGRATATLNTGIHIGTATLTATAGSVDGVVELEVVPGSVGDVRIRPEAGTEVAGVPVSLRADVFDVYGNPVEAGIQVSFTTTLGALNPPSGDTDAAGAVTTTLVATRTGVAVVSAHVGSLGDATAVEFVPGSTAEVVVSGEPTAIPVDGATSAIEALLLDEYGNPVVDAVLVTFASSLGSLEPTTTTAQAGRATSTLTSGAIHGTAKVTATIGAYTGTAAIEFLPADLRIRTRHEPTGEILPGTAMTYTMTFSNVGSALARDVLVSDTVPVGLIDLAYSSSGSAITATAGTTYTWQVEDLAPGEGGTIVLTGRFDPDRQWPASQLVGNVAEITSVTAEGNPSDNTSAASNLILTTDVYLEANLDASGTDPRPGGKLRYHLAFGNYSTVAADGLMITSTLPAHTSLWNWGELGTDPLGLTHLSDPGDPIQVWGYPDLVEGANFGEMYVWLNVAPDAPGGAVLENEIAVGTNTPESDRENNRRRVASRLEGVNLALDLLGPETVVPDRLITYTVRYTNTGTVGADGVDLVNVLSPGVALIDVSGPATTPVVIEPGRVEWDLGTVLPGQFGQVVLIGRVQESVSAGEVLSHTAGISTSTEESYLDDNAAAVTARVVPDVPYTVTLEMHPTTLAVGTSAPLQVGVRDRFGNAISGLTIALTSTVGSVTPTLLTTPVGGAASATFQAPTRPGSGNVQAVYDGLSNAVAVEVEPGPAAHLSLESSTDELLADGESVAVISASVRDAHDNWVANGTSVSFNTNVGSLYEPGRKQQTVGTLDGLAATTLIAPHIEEPSPPPAVVIVSADGVAQQIEIRLAPVSAPRSYSILLPLVTR